MDCTIVRFWIAACELVCGLKYGRKAAYIQGGREVMAGILAEAPRHV
jgi:hypothetical protein